MKKTFLALLVCLALVLCLTPVLVACDSGKDVSALEGRHIAKYTSMDKTHYVKMYQVEDTNGADKVKCALILYTADGTALDSVSFDVKVNGEDAKFECFHQAIWHDDKVEIIVRDHDNAETTYTLKYAE